MILEPGDPPGYVVSQSSSDGRPPLLHATLSPQCDVLCVDLSHEDTAIHFGLDPSSVLDFLSPWREAAAHIVDDLRAGEQAGDELPVVGISYRSQHRGTNALNVGLIEGRFERHFQSSIRGPFDPALEIDLNQLARRPPPQQG